jgi:hypothetical protein
VKLFLAGLAVTMGNPKVMVFYLALLPTLLDLARVTVLGYAELVAVTLAVLGSSSRAISGLRRAPAAVHEPARHPLDQPHHGNRDGGRRGRDRLALTGRRAPPALSRDKTGLDALFPRAYARVGVKIHL